MDIGALASALIDARLGQLQLALAAKLLRSNADAGASIVKMIDAAQQNIDRLANVAAGIGQNLDVSA
jgi:hypothetical protein